MSDRRPEVGPEQGSGGDLHLLTGAYALDALPESERVAFEVHLAGCSSCREEVAGLTSAAVRLGAATERGVPADLRARVLDQVARTRQLPPVWAAEPDAGVGDETDSEAGDEADLEPGAEPGAAGLEPGREPEREFGRGSGREPGRHGSHRPSQRGRGGRARAGGRTGSRSEAGNGGGSGDGSRSNGAWWSRPRTRRRLAGLAVAALVVAIAIAGGIAVVQTTRANQRAEQVAAVLAAPDSRTVHGTLQGGGRVTLVVSAREGATIATLRDLPDPPAGRTYQLWLIRGQNAVSAGLLGASGAGSDTRVLTTPRPETLAFGITVEPSGGSHQPTTKPLAAVPLR